MSGQVYVREPPPPRRCVGHVTLVGGHEYAEKAVAIVRLAVGFPRGRWSRLQSVTPSSCFGAWSRTATRSAKTLKVVVAVVTSFFVFWLLLPGDGDDAGLFPAAMGQLQTSETSLDASVLLSLVAYINCINPII